MAVPKRKTSKSKLRSRQASHKRPASTVTPCPSCGADREPHRACASCGTYKGRQVLTIEPD